MWYCHLISSDMGTTRLNFHKTYLWGILLTRKCLIWWFFTKSRQITITAHCVNQERASRRYTQLKPDRHIKLGYTSTALHSGPRLPTPEQTFVINFLKSFERGINEKRMHLLLDRWWGSWFDWCRRQTQQRSEPCGNRSWVAYAIPFDWCGLRCQKRPRIKQISRYAIIPHSVFVIYHKGKSHFRCSSQGTLPLSHLNCDLSQSFTRSS